MLNYYNSGSSLLEGAVVVLGSIVGVVQGSAGILSAAWGNLYAEGHFDFVKVTGAIAAGDAVYWNPTGNPVGGIAGSGAATSTYNAAYTLIGPCEIAALSADTTVRVINNSTLRTATLAGSITADAITGTDSSLGISGQNAAQGGAIALVGGTSSTSGNAGGAITGVGGTPGDTGIGGGISWTGGVGGTTSGSGGAVTIAGGAGTAGNASGGAVTINGGALNGSGANGSVTIQSSFAPVAGGGTSAAILCTSTAALGLYFGTGAPTFSAAKGSLYMKTDAATAATRLYVATDAVGTWAAFTAAS